MRDRVEAWAERRADARWVARCEALAAAVMAAEGDDGEAAVASGARPGEE